MRLIIFSSISSACNKQLTGPRGLIMAGMEMLFPRFATPYKFIRQAKPAQVVASDFILL